MKKRVLAVCLAALLLLPCMGCGGDTEAKLLHSSSGEEWYFGFGSREISLPEAAETPLYIAGYHNGLKIGNVLDLCQARAAWLDTGEEGVLLIGIDCVALDSGTVKKIRQALKDVPNCAAIHVYATHTHAGVDTLGLWGPIGINGKNEAYMQALIEAAEAAGRDAVANRRAGKLYYGAVETENMYRDSRDPQVYDAKLYQLRFEAETGAGLRLYFYGAHAEALRGSNRMLSRDYPGLLCDGVTAATGDDTMFFPGAIGGLIMTKDFVGTADAGTGMRDNLKITGEKLVAYALSIAQEREITPQMKLSRAEFTVPLDNPAFLTYKLLGILDNQAVRADSATGYGVRTELSVLLLGDLALTLIPGETFPELVFGSAYGNTNPSGENPRPLVQIAADHGLENMLIIGLANDEIGYIVPPSDFLLNEKMPYLERTMDSKGEDHYEETNSVGPECAAVIAKAFTAAVEALVG